MMEWYLMSESERIKSIYSKYNISDFFNWWSNNQSKWMEVRIKNFELVKEVAKKYNLPYSASGVYINSGELLKAVIAYTRDKATVWMGVNPRKWNYTKFGKKGLGGSLAHIDSISFLFIDIDRKQKIGPATADELKNVDTLAEIILSKLKEYSFANDYCKLCSGNGCQILCRLDYPISVPNREFDKRTNTYIDNEEFEDCVGLLRAKIGKELLKLSKKYEDELGVSIDKASFNLAGVCGLTSTKNYKYDGFTWRGILELVKNGENIGLTDYIINIKKDKKFIFVQPREAKNIDRLIPGKLREHPLVRFMLQSLPVGDRNNRLWFSLKLLLRDSKINLNNDEFKKLHKDIEIIWKDTLTLNVPEKKFTFSRNTVNSYCVDNLIPPIYPLWENRIAKRPIKIENVTFDAAMLSTRPLLPLLANTTIEEDMNMFDGMLKDNDYGNIDLYSQFIKACVNKYGEQKIRYYVQYVFTRFFCWK